MESFSPEDNSRSRLDSLGKFVVDFFKIPVIHFFGFHRVRDILGFQRGDIYQGSQLNRDDLNQRGDIFQPIPKRR